MKLIRKLGTRLSKTGKKQSWGLFWCGYCQQEVERRLDSGKLYDSCGCNNIHNYTHGESKTRIYIIWNGIKGRCLNPKNKSYKNYGGRGITICPEWAESYMVFKDWALSHGYKENLEIDRKENDLGYYSENCHFLTTKENNRKRKIVKLTLEKKDKIIELYATGKYTQKELGKIYNVEGQTISKIIHNKRWKN